MKLETIFDIYELICSGSKNIISRNESFKLRKDAFGLLNSKIIKNAFDTRKIDQETSYNPRRGLQNYHRSEPFVSKNMKKKVEAFTRLSKILDEIKSKFGREYEWQDSYVRVLQAAVEKGLRVKEADEDFSEVQPSMASLDYLDELMYVRYRLTSEDLMTMAEEDLRNVILSKDELLVNGGISSSPIIPSDINKNSYDDMMQKVLTSVAQMMAQMKTSDKKNEEVTTIEKTNDNGKTVTINIKV